MERARSPLRPCHRVVILCLVCCLIWGGSLALSSGVGHVARGDGGCPSYASTVLAQSCQVAAATAVAAQATPCPGARSVLYGAVQNVSFDCGVTYDRTGAQNPTPVPAPWLVDTDDPGLTGGVVWDGKVGVGQYSVARWTGQQDTMSGMADPGQVCASDAYDSGTAQYFVAPGSPGVSYTSVITYGLNSNVGAPCTTATNLVLADWTPPSYPGNVYVQNCFSSDSSCNAPHMLTATIPMTGGDLYRLTFETQMAYGMFYVDGWTYQTGDPAASGTPTPAETPTPSPAPTETPTRGATNTPAPLCQPATPTPS